MTDYKDHIPVPEGSITIRYGLDENGNQIWGVHMDGDIRFLTALGLLENAKAELRRMYGIDHQGDQQ